MTSVESIGSCSLDVDATASETSDDGRTSSVSQRTLHSTSVELGSGSSGTQGQVAGMSHSPTKSLTSTISEITKGVVSSTNEKRFVSELYIPSGRIHSGHDKSDTVDHDLQRKLSYINLSCSVSGYTSYSCYNSKVREELRSRDNSPARFGVPLSNEQANDLPTVSLEVTEDGVLKTMSKSKPTKLHTSNITLNVNSNGSDVVDRASRFSLYEEKSVSVWRTSSEDGILNRYSKQTVVNKTDDIEKYCKESANDSELLQKACNVSSAIYDNNNNNDEDEMSHQPVDSYNSKKESKSLIEQKIERLFGPGALAPGFRIHRERKQNSRIIGETFSASSTELSVIKLKSPGLRCSSHPVGDRTENLISSSGTVPEYQPKPKISSNGLMKPDKIPDQLIGNVKGKSIIPSMAVNGTNGEPVQDGVNGTVLNDQHNGKWFIDVMNKEREKIKSLISKAEQILSSEVLSEDAAGKIRAAIGKATLLLTQKFLQFQGLCEKNLNQSGDDPFPTTVEDLEGFWDMVLIQVNDIYDMFDAIEKARKQGWVADDKEHISTSDKDRLISSATVCDGPSKKVAVRKSKSSNPHLSSKSEDVAKAREEARRRLLEAKRKGRQQAATNVDNLGIEIYVPEEKE